LTRLVYIGGYGHSGSTLLEYLLAASPEVIACGEVASVLRERGRQTPYARGSKTDCTCGRKPKDCPVWGPLQGSPHALDGWTHARLTLALLERAQAGHAAILVDSSKTPWLSVAMPFRLNRALGPDFQLVHLVRHPRAVCWSAVKKAGRRGARPLMALRCAAAAAGWSIANLACELFGLLHPQRYLRLRYEDLARSPAAAMQDLFARLVPEVEWSGAGIGARGNRHQLYGNRMRRRTLSLDGIKEDAAWNSEMPRAYRALVGLLTFPLRRRYGYA
jgi:hypothetical protein